MTPIGLASLATFADPVPFLCLPAFLGSEITYVLWCGTGRKLNCDGYDTDAPATLHCSPCFETSPPTSQQAAAAPMASSDYLETVGKILVKLKQWKPSTNDDERAQKAVDFLDTVWALDIAPLLCIADLAST